jgi:tetratricopeptide (TPR) repeat protein
MLGSFLPVALLLLTANPDTLDPHVVVGDAIRAIEGDSAAGLGTRWQARVARDSSDRSALFGLATLARLQYRYPEAERLYSRVLGSDTLSPDGLGAYSLLGRAQALDAQGANEKAVAAIARARSAARLLHDRNAEGEALLLISLQRAYTAGIEAALATLDTVERLVPPTRYDLHAMRMRQRAAFRGIVGRPEAHQDAREALALARKSGFTRLVGAALKSEAQILFFEGKRDSSVVVLRQAEEQYRRAHDRVELASTLLWHVNALLNQGDLGQANELVHQAIEEGKATSNQFAVASAYTAAGSIALSLNDYPAASQDLDRSIALFQQVGDPAGEMKARDYLTVTAFASGDLAGARRQALEVLSWYRKTGEAQIEFPAHRNLAMIAMREGNWSGAEQALRDARALANRMHRPLWTNELAYDEGRLALHRGDLAQAERKLTGYLATLDSSQHVFRHDARVRLAEVYARRGELERAEREATGAWDDLDHWRATLSDAELRVLAFQASATEMSDRDAEVVRLLGEIARRGRVTTAFELAERRRARELADRLSQANSFRRDNTESRAGEPARPIAPVTTSAVTAEIRDDSTAILEYVTGSFGAPTTLFLLTRGNGEGNVRSIALPPMDSLEPEIARFEALMQGGAASDESAAILGKALLVPAVDQLGPGIRRLVIVPDGPLHRLPFDALRLGGRFAAERYAISLAPSAGVLVKLWAKPAPSRPVRLLALGDPEFSPDDSLPRLPRSAGEARMVASYAPGSEVKLGKEASASYLRTADLDSFRVIHLATHTLVDEHSAARTALVLAPGDRESGRLGPGDLAALRLDADLVVLSSCRSAGGVVVNGEGVQGLIAPLFQAGAHAVVATRWEIGDRNALDFVRVFYHHLAEGETVGEALRLAKLDSIRDHAPAQQWAAFTLTGDPLVRIPLRAPSGWRSVPVVALLLILGMLAGAFYWLRTRSGRTGETRLEPGVRSRTHHS